MEAAGFVLASFSRFYRDFCKIEQARTNELADFFSTPYVILKEMREEHVHAETQLLEKIIRESLYESGDSETIHFGISKLSCLQCYELLIATNLEFEARGIKRRIVFSGKHDLSFEKRWVMPAIFTEGSGAEHSAYGSSPAAASSLSEADYLAIAIGKRAQQAMTDRLRLPAPKGVYQRTSVSSGSEPQMSSERKLYLQQAKLESMLEMMKQLPYPEQRNIELLELGFRIISTDVYKHITHQINSDETPTKIIGALLAELSLTEDPEGMVKDFLRCENLVGERLSEYFKPLLESGDELPTPFESSHAFFSAQGDEASSAEVEEHTTQSMLKK